MIFSRDVGHILLWSFRCAQRRLEIFFLVVYLFDFIVKVRLLLYTLSFLASTSARFNACCRHAVHWNGLDRVELSHFETS